MPPGAKSCYAEGRKARQNAKPDAAAVAVPYPLGSSAYELWVFGWQSLDRETAYLAEKR